MHTQRIRAAVCRAQSGDECYEDDEGYEVEYNDDLYAAETSGRVETLSGNIVVAEDDLDSMLHVFPGDIRNIVAAHPDRANLLEVILDLGRRPEARFQGDGKVQFLREEEITSEDLVCAVDNLGDFGGDNRAGIEGTLHRISCMRNRRGNIVGLTCRVGRAVSGHVGMVQDLLERNESMLFLGRPGVGKTTVIRELARVLSDELHKRVVIVDTSNEIGGDGDVPHHAIGSARRMQVADPSQQHRVMIEAVENHMPQIVIVDEIGTEAEALACRTIAERGVILIGTAHGQFLENLIKNPTLSDLVGGVHTVTLGDDEARIRGTSKSILERKAPPTFPVLLEMRERDLWVTHRVEESVDALLQGKRPHVQVRTRDAARKGECRIETSLYDLEPNLGQKSRAVSELEIDAAFGSTGPADPYTWAKSLGSVPDKDFLEDQMVSAFGEERESRWSYLSSKRGRKPRNKATRH